MMQVQMAELLPVATADEIALAEHAAVIRAIGKRVVGDILEIGRRLDAARDLLKEEGRWRKWLDTELRWSPQTAGRFIQVFEASGKHSNLEHLAVPVSGLYLLAAPSTPAEAQQDIIARAEAGERLSVEDVRRIIEEARAKDGASHERAIADLRAEIARREQAVRAEYEGKLVLDPAKLQAEIATAIDKAVKPLEKDLEKAERKLATANEQLQAKRAAEPPPGPKIDSGMSLASTSAMLAIHHLVEKLDALTPKQMVHIEVLSAKHTQQTPADRLGKSRDEAMRVVRWLNEFIAMEWEGDQ
ncbi:DUF3102 domain-containing protein [Bradyrhizobium sp. S3.9.1]|uniref:DUF3102 domain-containing protein n=1 Tax=Bradyrhizobium sp. S3.9.1 TaxID=3156431 RepID=UPI0033925F1E